MSVATDVAVYPIHFALNYASQNDSSAVVAAWSSIINEKNDEVTLLEQFHVACTTAACLERLRKIKILRPGKGLNCGL